MKELPCIGAVVRMHAFHWAYLSWVGREGGLLSFGYCCDVVAAVPAPHNLHKF